MTDTQAFSYGEVIRFGWEKTKQHIKFLALVLLGVWVIQFIFGFFQNQIDFWLVDLILGIGGWLVNLVVSLALLTIALKITDGGTPGTADLTVKLPLFKNYLVGSIYYGLIVLGGMLLLVIPGIIWAIQYQFYPYAIVDKGASPKEALAMSKQMTMGRRWRLFLFGSILGLLNLGGALLFGVGLLVTVPISMIGMAYLYRKLSTR